MRSKKYLVIGLAALLGAGGLCVYQMEAAKPGGPGGAQFKGLFAQRIAEKLGLDDEQVAKIKKVRNDEKDYVLSKLTELHKARVELRTTIQSGGNEKAVRAAHAKVAAVEADLAVERAKVYAKISPILTSEQMAKVQDFQRRKDENVEWFLKNIGSHPALND
jgi:Spy/CpxP family protein refolding chaperone